MKIQFRCKAYNLSPIDQIWPTSFYITKCVYTNEIQFKNKIDTITVICELHGEKSNTKKYILEKLDNNARKETWEMKL